ncbi:hypothetical protein QWY93_16955 [Echinicola jeungdonensis]|nr:hypothetical protein [Echinicola jeungdonensis]MDN3671006.1 hypothetical protein [Echinicola jeungdonensis]
MEEMDLNSLKLFLEEELVLIPSELKEIQLAQKLKKQFEGQEEDEEDNIISEMGSSSQVASNGNLMEQEERAYLEKNQKLQYEGEIEKGLLIIYQGKQLDNNIREFLFKILGAISFSLKDIALVSSESLSIAQDNSIEQLDPHKVIVFGKINHTIAGLNTAFYEIITEGEREFLFADDLVAIFEDETLKRKLWKILQVFFNINK